MNEQNAITRFLAGSPFAVVGASRDPSKIGYRVVDAYRQAGREVYPVNPHADEIANLTAWRSLDAAPQPIHGVSVITQPTLAEFIVELAAGLGIGNIWFQPGAESDAAVARAEELGMNCIAGGPCLLVVLGYRAP